MVLFFFLSGNVSPVLDPIKAYFIEMVENLWVVHDLVHDGIEFIDLFLAFVFNSLELLRQQINLRLEVFFFFYFLFHLLS